MFAAQIFAAGSLRGANVPMTRSLRCESSKENSHVKRQFRSGFNGIYPTMGIIASVPSDIDMDKTGGSTEGTTMADCSYLNSL